METVEAGVGADDGPAGVEEMESTVVISTKSGEGVVNGSLPLKEGILMYLMTQDRSLGVCMVGSLYGW